MSYTFNGCTALTQAPVIPDSVTDMSCTFKYCTNLTGTVTIDANPASYSGCFSTTFNPITLTGSSTMLEDLAATGYGNVTVQ